MVIYVPYCHTKVDKKKKNPLANPMPIFEVPIPKCKKN